jgi:hypothetical protein
MMFTFTVHWQGLTFAVLANDWQPDDQGVSFLSAPFEDKSADILAFFSHPVAILKGNVVQSSTSERAS